MRHACHQLKPATDIRAQPCELLAPLLPACAAVRALPSTLAAVTAPWLLAPMPHRARPHARGCLHQSVPQKPSYAACDAARAVKHCSVCCDARAWSTAARAATAIPLHGCAAATAVQLSACLSTGLLIHRCCTRTLGIPPPIFSDCNHCTCMATRLEHGRYFGLLPTHDFLHGRYCRGVRCCPAAPWGCAG